ncbi:helix-turn-helix transcriptional regulator [Shivajiella indica]|uniref:Helix-turn-helix transcriptional regulator n=1 Tax=Shivajiella indica TaxID=872115 RepID=A0ABW5B1X6_9BACT
MSTSNYFTTRKPIDQFLSTVIDYYFFIDVPLDKLSLNTEFIIPFPRITLGYFFNHSFKANNLTRNESQSVNWVFSRMTTDRIIVEPQTEKVKIIGAHARPFFLAYLTPKSLKDMSWLIAAEELLYISEQEIQIRLNACENTALMFEELEKVLLEKIILKELSLLVQSIEIIEKRAGNIGVTELSRLLGVSDRTIRNQFYDFIGCSPKDYIKLVKLKQVAFQLRYSNNSLTDIAHDNHYFDQAHFIHELKNITGQSPNQLRKEMENFRFLQF